MTTPHKDAEFIHVWADGKEIQQRPANQMLTSNPPQKPAWGPFDGTWRDDYEYRIKPAAPVVETKMTPPDWRNQSPHQWVLIGL